MAFFIALFSVKPSHSAITLFCFSTLLMLLLLLPDVSSDPDPLQDLCVADLSSGPSSPTMNGFPCKPASEVTPEDFFFDGLAKPGDTANTFGSKVTDASVRSFPGVNTLGLSMIRVDIAPNGGQNTLHVHPRSTEILVVIEGKLQVGFATADDKFYTKMVGPGEVFVIPRAMVHFQINREKKPAHFFAAFNSHLPGIVTIPTNIFATNPTIPNDVLTRAFQVSASVVKTMKLKLQNASSPYHGTTESRVKKL